MENYDQLLVYLWTRLEHFDNDCVTFLRKHSKKYVETEQKMNEILEHTAIKNFLINEDSIYLTEEEHKLFIRYMGLENYLYTLENAVIYLLGCHDTTILQSIFHEFKNVIEAWGGEVVTNQLIENNGRYYIDFDDLRNKAKQGAKFMIVCNPHNPVGRVWSKEELEAIANICIENNITIISDEIYSDIMLWGNKHTPMASISEEIRKHTITCTSSTKTFNLAGLQVATVIFPNLNMKNQYDAILKKIETYRNNAFSIVANTIAFTEGKEWFLDATTYIEENIKYAVDYINSNIPQIKVSIPDSTYLLWLDCRNLNLDGDDLVDFFVNKARLALNDGRLFGDGGDGYMRINIACPRRILEKALYQLENAVDSYNFDKYELISGC